MPGIESSLASESHFKRNAVDDFIALVLFIADIHVLDQGSQARLAEGLNGFANLTPEDANHRIRDYLEADTSQLLSETERTAFARRFAVPDEHGVDVSARLTWLTAQAEQSVVRMHEQTEPPPAAPLTSDSILSVPRYTLDEVLVSFISEQGVERALQLLSTALDVIVCDSSRPLEVRRKLIVGMYQVASRMGLEPMLVDILIQRYDMPELFRISVPLGEQSDILVGNDPQCDVVLLESQVEPLHAVLQKDGSEQWAVHAAEAARRFIWSDDHIVSVEALKSQVPFQIGGHCLTRDDNTVNVVRNRQNFSLGVQDLQRKIGDLVLLEGITFNVFSGEVIALIGPSGCGKTTLLNAINGVAPADTGDVLLNGHSFHQLLERDRSLVGIVPQDDLVLPELTVEESLYYSGRLRLPPHFTEQEVWKEVDRVLVELDIDHIRHQRIGDAVRRGISGGQRKRVNLGQELISQSTKILFLDEPTSGLDPRASQDIVRLVRRLADRGRIVFLVTHDLTEQVVSQVDNLLVMIKGGRLAFFGRQIESLSFFNVPSADAIFQRFDDQQSRWQTAFKKHRNMVTRPKALELRGNKTEPPPLNEQSGSTASLLWRQLKTLTHRYARVKLRDRTGMLVIALQPPFLAAVMAAVFYDGENQIWAPTYAMIFMLSLSCLWFGMSASVRELISDQVIFRRERRVGVLTAPYVGSKVIVLGVLTALQAMFLAAAMYYVMPLTGEYAFSLPALLGVSALTAWLGMSLGLFISSLWRSSEAAVGTLPLVLIPQIAFSSVMFAIRDMGAIAKFVTWFTFQRYTFDAFLKCGEEIATRTRRGDFEAQPINGTLWKLGLKMSDKADDIGFSLTELCTIIGLITVVLIVISGVRVWQRERQAN